MRELLLVMPCVVTTFLAWGVYGPALHRGQEAMPHSSLRPFMCVGLAYFLVAVVAPILVLRSRGEAGKWTLAGVFWSLAAGAVGALGALEPLAALGAFGGAEAAAPLRAVLAGGALFPPGAVIGLVGSLGPRFASRPGRSLDEFFHFFLPSL